MAKTLNVKYIESKWQKIWQEKNCFSAQDYSKKPKFYGLIEFPYPSGSGLHVGHIRAYTSLEVIARKKRLEGYNVLFPIGWDAFGLPTENYAMQTKQHPRAVTDKNIRLFIKQLKRVGFSFDWDRMVDTTDPNYYKWTQWIFIQLFKKGLAYKSKAFVNFCPTCQVVLANEESQGGVCDRCNCEVVQKEKNVWFLKIRDYADRLLEDLEELDFLPRIKLEQRNWIGKSFGAEIDFELSVKEKLRVFTTRADTLFGATFVVIAPEHPIIEKFANSITNIEEIADYQEKTRRKNEFERVQLQKEKTGVKLEGIYAINPVNNRQLPIFVADYVMMDYGTGAIMAVPAHDSRDYEFAQKFGIEIIEVIEGGNIQKEPFTDIDKGTLVNSGFINDLSVKEAIEAMTEHLIKEGIGQRKVNYNMKDWAFNRQRYWGEPIPIVYCEKCGMVHIPEEELPLLLPELESYEPTTSGESPLSTLTDWVECSCPVCGGKARRETDTMPQWAGSSWYFLRYIDPNNNTALADWDKLKYWGPIDWYNGGMEHVTRHLIYSRFWNKFLYDIGVVPFSEPYQKRTAQGLLLGEDGEKMSKSRGNVINPDECMDRYGADVLRTFILFIGDYERPAPWSESGISGCRRFVDRVWRLQDIMTEDNNYSAKHNNLMHKLIKKVSDDYENANFNTAIAAMMGFINDIYSDNYLTRAEYTTLLRLLYPVAPHITEEINEQIGNKTLVSESDWPTYKEEYLIEDVIEIPVQICGKLKGVVSVARDSDIEGVKAAILESNLAVLITDKQIIKEIYVPNKIVNFIIK